LLLYKDRHGSIDDNAIVYVHMITDLVGVDGFDLIVEIVQHKHRIASLLSPLSPNQQQHQQHSSSSSSSSISYHPNSSTGTTSFSASAIDETANQRKKREQREERELQAAIQSSLSDSSLVPIPEGVEVSHHPDWLRQLGFSDEYLLVERSLGLQKGGADSRARPENWLDDLAPEGRYCR